MFDILGRGAVKVAEVSGIIDEQPEPVEVVIGEQPGPRMEDRVVTLKQVGHVRPVLLDPAEDLKILEELFGVYHEAGAPVKKLDYSCPGCGTDTRVDYDGQPLDMEAQIQCAECDHIDKFSVFFDGIESVEAEPTTSRTPTDKEVDWVISGALDNLRWQGWHDENRDYLRTYYGILLGKEPLIDPDYEGRDLGYVEGGYRLQCNGCTSSCRCDNYRMRYFGKLHPLSDMPQEDD